MVSLQGVQCCATTRVSLPVPMDAPSNMLGHSYFCFCSSGSLVLAVVVCGCGKAAWLWVAASFSLDRDAGAASTAPFVRWTQRAYAPTPRPPQGPPLRV